MFIDFELEDNSSEFVFDFGEVREATDGGYERGYVAGHTDGVKEGYSAGYENGKSEGLATRTYETWTITLTDGNVIEKEVALI